MSPESSIGIDHIAFGALHLESARQGFVRLGFSVTERGCCTWNTPAGMVSAGSYSVMFDRCYLDVIEHDDARWRAHCASSPLYGRGMAPSGIVLRAGSIEEAMRRFDQRQVAYSSPYDITRRFDGRPEVQLRYRLLPLDRRSAGGLPLAVIHDSDPAAMRTPAWLSHPSGAVGLARVTVRVADRSATERALGVVLGAESRQRDRDGPSLDLVHDPADGYLRAVAAAMPVSDRPALLALTFWSDLDAITQLLRRNGVQWTELTPERIGIDLNEGMGCGVILASPPPT